MSHVNDVRWSLLDGWMVPLGVRLSLQEKEPTSG